MAKVTEICRASKDRVVFICDFSPPRGGDRALLSGVQEVSADFFSVAYSPGKSVRADSAMVAYMIKQQVRKDVVFSLATRDMNRLALENYLLGACLLGLENLTVVRGDAFTESELSMVRNVQDFKPTELIKATKSMNEGIDYKGLKLRSPTDFCVGAAFDLTKDVEREARLAYRKASAGADFFITQSVYKLDRVEEFYDRYSAIAGERLTKPVFFGLQVLEKESILFGEIPQRITQDLHKGRSGPDIAIELLHDFLAMGITTIYLVPPILRGGRRDYRAAQEVVEAAKQLRK